MHPQIHHLLEIQALDEELQTLNTQLAKYPVIWEDVKKRLAKKKAALDNMANLHDRHMKERKRTEQKLRLFADDLMKSQNQQSVVKTPREYEAITKQIDAIKKKIEQTEEQGLALMDKSPEVEAALKLAEDDFNKTKEVYLKEKERIRVQFNEKKERVKNLETERAKLTPKVEASCLKLYEHTNERYKGNAVVPVQGNSCTGCHWSILPDQMVAIHRADEVVTCSNCGRIISEDLDFDPNHAAE